MKMREMKNYFAGKLVRLTVFFEKSKEIEIEEIQRN